MDRGEEELTAHETALYDRQIRVWGVDAQKRYLFDFAIF
jgi:ubiquitin-like 1-activating enzyme E1 A